MIKRFHVTDYTYRQVIGDPASEGRVPHARLVWGNVSGSGWGFLRPWEQIALFPEKGTLAGIRSPARAHEEFIIRYLEPFADALRHPRHLHPITGRYWHGIVWRSSWKGWRRSVLDPDIVIEDPNQNEDWIG